MIHKAKVEHWVEWLEGLDETSVWQASRLVTAPTTDAGRVRIPTLQVKDPVMKWVTKEAMDNTSKGHLFYNAFFPPANPALTPPPENYRYLLPHPLELHPQPLPQATAHGVGRGANVGGAAGQHWAQTPMQ